MGCCSSRPRGDQTGHNNETSSSPAALDIAAASRLNGPPPIFRQNYPRTPSSVGSIATSTAQVEPVALNEHFNEPLRTHIWRTKASRRPWSRSKWLSMREEFFDTRVTNRAEVWGSLKAAVELLDQGEIETAQGILTASEITLPTGDLCDGAYDSFGNLYQLPPFAVSAPENMVEDGDPAASTKPQKKEGAVSRDTAAVAVAPAAASGQTSSEKPAEATTVAVAPAEGSSSGKGKEVAKSKDLVSVKARLSDRARDVSVKIGKHDNAKVLIEAVAEQAGVPPSKIKIAYMGKVLKPNKGFIAQGWQLGHVVNALVLP